MCQDSTVSLSDRDKRVGERRERRILPRGAFFSQKIRVTKFMRKKKKKINFSKNTQIFYWKNKKKKRKKKNMGCYSFSANLKKKKNYYLKSLKKSELNDINF